jgi:uncharacterized membrane protein
MTTLTVLKFDGAENGLETVKSLQKQNLKFEIIASNLTKEQEEQLREALGG